MQSFGTKNAFETADIEEYLSRVIISRFNDHLGEHLDSLLNLAGRYDELSGGLALRLQGDFSQYGLGLSDLYITSITPPPEVQKAIVAAIDEDYGSRSRHETLFAEIITVTDGVNDTIKHLKRWRRALCFSDNQRFKKVPYSVISSKIDIKAMS